MVIAFGIRQFPELKDRKCDNCENAATDVLVDMADDEAHRNVISGALCESCILAEVRNMVDTFVATSDPSYETAVILVVAMFVGPDVDTIVRLTRSPKEHVETIASRMRSSGIWTGRGVDYEEWFAPGLAGVIGFGLSVDVAEGVFIRTPMKNSNGKWIYKLIDSEQRAGKMS